MGLTALPYDYEVEYLESTGTQWIDTEIVLNNTYSIEINLTPMEEAWNKSEHGVFGSSKDGYHNVLQIHQGNATGVVLYMPSGGVVTYKPIVIGTPQEWVINNNNDGRVLIDGERKGTARPNSSVDCPESVYLFSRNINGNRGNCALVRIHKFKIDDITIPVLNYIPVVKNRIGYMYDKVSGQLFGNSGIGEFIIGSRVTGGGKHLIIRMLPTFAERRWAA